MRHRLPRIHDRLSRTRRGLGICHRRHSSISLGLRTGTILRRVIGISGRLGRLAFHRTRVSRLCGGSRPACHTLLRGHRALRRRHGHLGGQMSTVPSARRRILHLDHSMRTNHTMCLRLLGHRRRLDVSGSDTVNGIQVVSPTIARPRPIGPGGTLGIILNFVLNLFVSINTILTHTVLHHNMRTPRRLRRRNVDICTAVPVSR